MSSLLTDPLARLVGQPAPQRSGAPLWLVVGLASALGATIVGGGMWALQQRTGPAPASVVEVRPTNDVLIAIKDISKLEVTEIDVEKVVDLSDKQKKLWGYYETTDSMLLVAAGSAVVGVDLEKLEPGDVSYDEETRVVRMRLPLPEVLSTRLHPDNTYVYKRETETFATRNEALEGRARKEALAAVEKAAQKPEVMERAKKNAEKQLTGLLVSAGAKEVKITWKPTKPAS